MKKIINVIRWVGVAVFILMALVSISEGVFLAALLFFLGGVIIAPLNSVRKLRSKLKLNKALSIVLAIVFLFGGTMATPTVEPSDIPNDNSSILDNSSEKTALITESPESTNQIIENNEISSLGNVPTPTATLESTPEPTPTPTLEPTPEPTPTPTISSVGNGKAEPVNPSTIPSYSGKAYVSVNNNIPSFSSTELTTIAYEKYSSLDNKGRCGVAIASCGKEIMPGADEKRGSISNITPSGWNQAKYDGISGGWLWNRCHLIGWQLSAENANKQNLITGTRYMNIEGMLTFENMVADYIKETGNHVAYRVTPIFEGNNLVCSGVQMEAYSIEDNGDGICFNVYCYNVQPGININYKNGESYKTNASSTEKTEITSTTKPTVEPTPKPTKEPNLNQNTQTVYTTTTGKKYHSRSSCSGLSRAKKIFESTLSDARAQGLGPCSICY